MKRLDGIEDRLAAATPGPWERIEPNADDGDIRVQVYHANKRNVVHDSDSVAWKLKIDDATFIANAPGDIRDLLAVVKLQREALEFYGDPESYDLIAIQDTPGNLARKALETCDKILD